jgi:TetR/AcrR family transcriptional repressor of nem operon
LFWNKDMARNKEFEPGEALNKAMLLFWKNGYLETSIEELVQVTGVSRYGFYSTFGDKHDLFLKAMQHYASTAIQTMLGPMETETASTSEILRYFDLLLANAKSDAEQIGCLIGNTALELPDVDEYMASHIDSHFARMRTAFQNALTNAQNQQKVRADLDIAAYADYLVGTAVGFLACIRARLGDAALDNYLTVALAEINS